MYFVYFMRRFHPNLKPVSEYLQSKIDNNIPQLEYYNI